MQVGVSKSWGRRIVAAVVAAAAMWTVAASAQKTELLVYTALETDQIKAYEDAFYKAYPDIAIKWVRDSTGVITAKLLAEKANPQADLVVGTSASSLAVFANEGMLQGYAPKGLDKILPRTAIRRIRRTGSAWMSMALRSASIRWRRPSSTCPNRRRGRI